MSPNVEIGRNSKASWKHPALVDWESGHVACVSRCNEYFAISSTSTSSVQFQSRPKIVEKRMYLYRHYQREKFDLSFLLSSAARSRDSLAGKRIVKTDKQGVKTGQIGISGGEDEDVLVSLLFECTLLVTATTVLDKHMDKLDSSRGQLWILLLHSYWFSLLWRLDKPQKILLRRALEMSEWEDGFSEGFCSHICRDSGTPVVSKEWRMTSS